MKERLALVDLDTILFIVAYKQYEAGNKDREDLVKTHTKEFISTLLLNTRADVYSMVYQDIGHNNFRKYFYPDYKANRPEAPEFYTTWKNTIIEAFNELGAIGVKIIESDDVLNIGYYKFKEEYDVIIISADKDLDQIPGEHYNPRKHVSYSVALDEAIKSLRVQLLMGDTTDNIKGLPGIGPKKAEKILLQEGHPYENIHKAYQDSFQENWYSEFKKTEFLVSLLDELDRDLYYFKEEVPELFNLCKTSNVLITNLFN
jgi:DNA polymerase-1